MKHITVDELAATTNPTLIDVREPDEFASGHVPGAQNVPLGQLESRLSEIPADDDVYVICQSGGRSARAADFLATQGINAVNIEGGTSAWIGSGRETDTSK